MKRSSLVAALLLLTLNIPIYAQEEAGTVVLPEGPTSLLDPTDEAYEAEVAGAESGKPQAIITDLNGNPVPASIPVAETVFLSALQSTAGNKADSYIWIVTPKARADRARIMDSGRTLVVGAGEFEVDISVTLVVAKGDVPAVASVVIPVRRTPGPDPEPPVPPRPPVPPTPPTPPNPPPTPPTPPEPPVPPPTPPEPGTLGLTKWHYDFVMTIPAPRAATAKKIAAMFENAAGVVAAISTMTAQDLVTMTNASLKNGLTVAEKAAWDKWRTDAYIKKNKELQDNGNLPDDKNDHLDAWEEIVIGLRAVTD